MFDLLIFLLLIFNKKSLPCQKPFILLFVIVFILIRLREAVKK